jgi:hypothetical protein
MNRLCVLLLVIAFSFNAIYASDSTSVKRTAIGEISLGPIAKKKISPGKVESAFNLVCKLSKKYSYMDIEYRDSLLRKIGEFPKSSANLIFKDSLKISKLFNFRADVLGNIVRVQTASVDLFTGAKSEGVGFALAHYYYKLSEETLFDPALFEATQRAVAVAEKDSTLFVRSDSVLGVAPAPTLAITGVNFINEGNLAPWELFGTPEIKSYFAIEAIFDTLKTCKKAVIYDIASRDSLYALFRLKTPENFKSITPTEVACLAKLDVDYIISGEFKRQKDGATITLNLSKLTKDLMSPVNKVSDTVKDDKIEDFKKIIQELAYKLIQTAKI